jgi:uncharacterized membrane protein YiaA
LAIFLRFYRRVSAFRIASLRLLAIGLYNVLIEAQPNVQCKLVVIGFLPSGCALCFLCDV